MAGYINKTTEPMKTFKTRYIYGIAGYSQDFCFERMRENKETIFEEITNVHKVWFVCHGAPNTYLIDKRTGKTYYRLQANFDGWADHIYAQKDKTLILIEDKFGFSPYVISRGMSVKEIEHYEKIEAAKKMLIDEGMVVAIWPKDLIRNRVSGSDSENDRLSDSTIEAITENVCDLLNDNDYFVKFGLEWEYVDSLINRELVSLEDIDD